MRQRLWLRKAVMNAVLRTEEVVGVTPASAVREWPTTHPWLEVISYVLSHTGAVIGRERTEGTLGQTFRLGAEVVVVVAAPTPSKQFARPFQRIEVISSNVASSTGTSFWWLRACACPEAAVFGFEVVLVTPAPAIDK